MLLPPKDFIVNEKFRKDLSAYGYDVRRKIDIRDNLSVYLAVNSKGEKVNILSSENEEKDKEIRLKINVLRSYSEIDSLIVGVKEVIEMEDRLIIVTEYIPTTVRIYFLQIRNSRDLSNMLAPEGEHLAEEVKKMFKKLNNVGLRYCSYCEDKLNYLAYHDNKIKIIDFEAITFIGKEKSLPSQDREYYINMLTFEAGFDCPRYIIYPNEI